VKKRIEPGVTVSILRRALLVIDTDVACSRLSETCASSSLAPTTTGALLGRLIGALVRDRRTLSAWQRLPENVL
jgi:hypothetical protein